MPDLFLQAMILYVLCTSFGGVLTLTAAVLLGFPLPLLAVQLLWINLVTDGLPFVETRVAAPHSVGGHMRVLGKVVTAAGTEYSGKVNEAHMISLDHFLPH